MSAPTAPTTASDGHIAARREEIAAPREEIAAPREEIAALREEIDACDAQIIELVQRRLAVSREIGALRAATGGTRLSLTRESEVLNRFRVALGPDGAALGMMLLRQGRGRL